MSDKTPRSSAEKRTRRTFLRGVAVGGAAAAVATAARGAQTGTEAETEAGRGQAKGYRLTRHIRDYYKTAAF